MAVLLFSLLFTQLDPGGAMVCLAENGGISYSLNCSCDSPGEQTGPGCLACQHEAAESPGGCEQQDALPACCADTGSPDSKNAPEHKSCCHNFEINLILVANLQLSPPEWTMASNPLPVSSGLAVSDALISACSGIYADLPPPLPDRSPDNLLITRSIRLLL